MSDSEGPGGSTSAMIGERKRDLRSLVLGARRSRSVDERERQDASIRTATCEWLAERRPAPGTVAAYVPMPGEPGGASWPAALAGCVDRLLLPVLRDDRDLDWVAYDGGLTPAGHGLTEPTGPRLGVPAIGDAAVVIVPALAVDRHGVRLGRGGGSYDRALARVGPAAVVLAALYRGEVRSEVPAEAHDRPVHGVIVGGHVTIW